MIPKLEILTGDVRDVLLNRCKPKSVHCIVTSPPYWNLRSYGTPPQLWPAGAYSPMHGCPGVSYPEWTGELGQEPDINMFVGHIVEVFRAAREVLRDDGSLWVNFGDCYSASGRGSAGGSAGGSELPAGFHADVKNAKQIGRAWVKPPPGLGEKQLMMQPARVALALQADGWILRRDIVWNKKNPMPESVTDRPTCSHEFVYLFAKKADYYYDAEAIKEAGSPASHARLSQENIENQRGGSKQDAYLETGAVGKKSRDRAPQTIIKALARKLAEAGSGIKSNTSFDAACAMPTLSRNCRDVWTLGTEPFPGAHYATFPTALVRRPVLAGTSAAGCCPRCGTPWERIVDVTSIRRDELPEGHPDHRPGRYPVKSVGNEYDHGGCQRVSSSETRGWRPGCACDGLDPVPCTVMDVFGGSGTVGEVALEYGRNAILIDLDPRNEAFQRDRCAAHDGHGVLPGM